MLRVSFSYPLIDSLASELCVSTTAAPEDYWETMVQLVFSPGQTKQCTNITIVDDGDLEGAEDFEATLSTTVDRVVLDPEMATITIGDNDGKLELINIHQ